MDIKLLYNKYIEVLKKSLTVLPDKDEENVENTLKALWCTSAGKNVSSVTAQKMEIPELTDSQTEILDNLINQRMSGVPLAHLTGRQNFMELDYLIDKGLYIPRKETELLAKTAISVIKQNFSSTDKLNVIDLCTGSGSIALSVAYYCKNLTVYGSDIFAPAIESAKKNSKHFSLSDRAYFYCNNLFDTFANEKFYRKVDLITCNPPYISSSKVTTMAPEIANFEPKEAFDAGKFGLDVVIKLISETPKYLKDNAFLVFECGLGQGDFLANRLQTNGNYHNIEKVLDADGNVRVLKARRIAE